MIERTLCVIKPNAIADNKTGAIMKMMEDSNLKIVGLQMTRLTPDMIEAFYEEHIGKSFFERLRDFMTSGPVVAAVLEGEDAVSKLRRIMGATNPEKAEEGTIRKLYAKNMTENAVHGSDSLESARREIAFYFDQFSII